MFTGEHLSLIFLDSRRHTLAPHLLCCPPRADLTPFMCQADVGSCHANETHTHTCMGKGSHTPSSVSVQALAVSHTPEPTRSPSFALFKWKRLELSSACSLGRKPACQPPVPPHTSQPWCLCVCESLNLSSNPTHCHRFQQIVD